MAENGNDEKGDPTVMVTKPSSVIREYRIVLPLTTKEYHIGQLYGVAEASKNETGGGEGIEVIENRPITKGEMDKLPFRDQVSKNQEGDGCGQYTHKRFYLSHKVPYFVRILAPNNALEVDEKAWNCYPYCRTEYSNRYMADNFHIVIETLHEDDDGKTENVHNLTQQELIKRKVVNIDIANDACETKDYKETEDPSKFTSEVTGRGPLVGKEWQKEQNPVMCCYKLYRVLFKWKMLQNRVEAVIINSVRRLLFNFHRQVFCWIDKWHALTIEDIRILEEKTKKELNDMRNEGQLRGTVED